jgi:hypothetical protein
MQKQEARAGQRIKSIPIHSDRQAPSSLHAGPARSETAQKLLWFHLPPFSKERKGTAGEDTAGILDKLRDKRTDCVKAHEHKHKTSAGILRQAPLLSPRTMHGQQ